MPTKLMMGIVVLCGVASIGCATMFTGSAQQVTVSSQPPGARVFVNGGYSGVTPVSLLLRTERDYTVTLQREGFQDTTAGLVREFNPVAALNPMFTIRDQFVAYQTLNVEAGLRATGRRSAITRTATSSASTGPPCRWRARSTSLRATARRRRFTACASA